MLTVCAKKAMNIILASKEALSISLYAKGMGALDVQFRNFL